MDEQQAVPGIGCAVGEHQVVHHIRTQATRHQGRGPGHVTVHEHHAALARGLQHGASHHGDLESTERRQGFKRANGVAVPCGRRRELLHPLHMQCVVQVAGLGIVAAECVHQRHATQTRQQQGRAHRIGHAHIAQCDHVARQVAHHVHAGMHR
ncbi:hypothetical protein D9M68_836430 [compost metagenome]